MISADPDSESMIRRMETSNRKPLFEISSWNRFLNRSLKLVSESVLKPVIETVTGDFLGPPEPIRVSRPAPYGKACPTAVPAKA
jgi:hypothetical protein